jgi:hypothetical protein
LHQHTQRSIFAKDNKTKEVCGMYTVKKWLSHKVEFGGTHGEILKSIIGVAFFKLIFSTLDGSWLDVLKLIIALTTTVLCYIIIVKGIEADKREKERKKKSEEFKKRLQ